MMNTINAYWWIISHFHSLFHFTDDTISSQSYATASIYSSVSTPISSSVTISPTLSSSAALITTQAESDAPTNIYSSSISCIPLTHDIMTTGSNRISSMTRSAAHSPTNSAAGSVLLPVSSFETTVMVVLSTSTATSSEIISETSSNGQCVWYIDNMISLIVYYYSASYNFVRSIYYHRNPVHDSSSGNGSDVSTVITNIMLSEATKWQYNEE